MMTHPNDRDDDELPDWLLDDDSPSASSRPKPPSSPYDDTEALDFDSGDDLPTASVQPNEGLGGLVSDEAKAKAKASAQEAKAAAGRAGQAVSAKAGMASAWLKLKVAEFKANRASKAAERSSEKLQATVKAAEQEAKRRENQVLAKTLAATQGNRVELEPDLPAHEEMPRVRAELFTGPSPVWRNLGFAVLGLGVLGAAWWAWTSFGPDGSTGTDTPEPAPAVVQETPAAVAPPAPVEPAAPVVEEVAQEAPPPPPLALPPETEFDLPPLPPARAGEAPVVFEEEPVAPAPRAPRPSQASRPTPAATPAPRRPTVAEEEERQLQEQMRKLEEWGRGN